MVMIMKAFNDFPDTMIFDRDLLEEEIELIRREYQKLLSISKMKMDSIQYQLFLNKEGEVYFPKGTLIHGINCSLESLNSICNNGLLASEFLGVRKSSNTYYCTDFYKINSDTLISVFDKNFICDNVNPFNDCNNNLAFVINPTSKIGGLLYYDLLDSKFNSNPMVKNIIPNSEREILINSDNNISAILVGVPANAISGIVLGDKILLDDKIVEEIKKLFPNAYIISRRGDIIRDRSNIIKIEDYEKISLKCAREKVINQELNNKIISINEKWQNIKKEFVSYMTAVKNNTSYFEQASIYKELNRSIPTNLFNKLSDKEKEKLNKK